jgi:hypothetical protein
MSAVKKLSSNELFPVLSFIWENWKTELPEPINVSFLSESWAKLMGLGVANAYATFEKAKPVGVLLGMFTPDMHTGDLKGIEYLWAGKNTLKMLDQFESDCRARGCVAMICGVSDKVLGTRAPALRRLYRQRGFTPVTEAFSKRLK